MHSDFQSDSALGAILDADLSPPVSQQQKQFKAALNDILTSLRKSHIWLMLGYDDIKLRYRRSILGPFWITLSMAITVYSMGFLYSHLFHNDIATYFPFLTAGMLAWALISSTIIEITECFISSENLIKQIKLPYSMYVHRIIWRNILIFFHNLIVIVPIILIFHESAKINLYTLALIPHLLIFYVNAFAYGLILAVVGSRYRDLSQMVKSLVQVVFFMTPVIWNPALLPEHLQRFIPYNPFYDFAQLLRAPLIGAPVSWLEYAMVGLFTVIGLFMAMSLFSKFRARIVYWL